MSDQPTADVTAGLIDPFSSATRLAAMVRDRAVSPRELVELYLDRIGNLDPELKAFCRVAGEEALEYAEQLTAEVAARGAPDRPFLGVPIGIKESRAVRGWTFCGGSNAIAHPVAAEDAPAVKALRAAGFVIIGSLAAPEFGTVSVTESIRHGITRSPWDLDISPGGSSGAAAAAVAAGMLPIGHGSDGAGSIREPASYCGLVGLKPSRARVPASVHGLEGFVSEGVITRTVEDTAAVLDVLSEAPRKTWYVAPPRTRPYRTAAQTPLGRLQIGLNLEPAFPTQVTPAARQAVTRAAEQLSDLGHDVSETTIPGLDPEWFQETFDVIYLAGSAGAEIVDEDQLEPLNRYMRRRAQETDSITYVEAVYALQARSAEMVRVWDSFDVLLTPTNPVPAPAVGSLWEGQDDDPMAPLRRSEETAAFTVLANVLGLPAISLPLSSQTNGMPLGVQLVGGPWADATVLALAGELEREHPWHEQRPAGFA